MQIEEHHDLSRFEALRADWYALLRETPTATVHSTPEWIEAWWRHHHSGRTPWILVAREGARVLGIAPMMLTRSSAVRGLAQQRTLGFLAAGEARIKFLVAGDVDEARRLARIGVDLTQRQVRRLRAIGSPDRRQPIRIVIRQRAEQRRLDQAEYGGVGADAECQREDRDGGKAAIAHQPGDRVAKVQGKAVHARL